MLDAIEKCRKLLTANKEADVHCESLLEDEDLHKHFKREELETLMEPFIEKFKATLQEALTMSGKLSHSFHTKITLLFRSNH